MTKRPDVRGWEVALLLGPVVLFGIFFAVYAVNVPWFDDFEAIPGFLLEYLDAPTWREKMAWLLLPNNEHRMVTGKALTVGLHALTGELNYIWIQAVANLGVFGVLWLFWRGFRTLALPAWYFLPVVLVLIHPQYHLLTFWTITGVQHEPLVFFMVAALYFLAKGTRAGAALAAFFALLATFTMSNGMFVWIAGAGVLLLRQRYRALGGWVLGMALAVGAYFYEFPSRANTNSFAKFLETPYLSLTGFFTFLGGSFDAFPRWPDWARYGLSTLGGLLVVGWALRWAWRQATATQPLLRRWRRARQAVPEPHAFLRDFALGVLLFLFANGAIIALLRPHFGYYVMLVGNYKLYPALLLAVSYLAWLTAGVPTRRSVQRLLAASGMLWLASYAGHWPEVTKRRKTLLASTYSQYHGGVGLGATRGTILEPYAIRAFNEPLRRGFFHPPLAYFDDLIRQPPAADSLPLTVSERPDVFLLSQPTLSVPDGRDAGVFVLVTATNSAEQYLLVARQQPYQGRNPFGRGTGFVVEVPKGYLRPGPHRVTVLRRAGARTERYLTPTVLAI